jgi:hypothetical protein
VATKRQTSSRRAAAPVNGIPAHPAHPAGTGWWRSRVHKPAETDPKKRVEAIHEAASLIKTDARIDTITLGRD